MWLEDVLYGALTSGVNKPTVVLLNASLVGCIFLLTFLLVVSIKSAPGLILHFSFLLILAVGLLILINWFLMQIGLVRAEDQQRELFSGGQPEPEASSAQQKKAE